MTEINEFETITLSDFIQLEEKKHAGASGTLSNLLLSIALGTKIVARGVNRAGLAAMLGLTGEINVQGEKVQKLDVYADSVFTRVLGRSGEFFSLVSEEHESVVAASDGGASSRYVIALDPLDGSSNIDSNVSIGTIWGVYKRISKGSELGNSPQKDFFQGGRKQVAAGYTIYGSSTMFVFTTGTGVFGFTLDPTIGEFILTNPKMQIPKSGKTYSCNEGNFKKWPDGVRNYIQHVKGLGPNGGGGYSARYVGSLVADFHRTLLKGGIFLYPSDEKNKNGKLRLLYECAPLAFIAEQAGGLASDGKRPILDMVANDIHQRTPIFIGSESAVQELEAFLAH